jgi:hypothetical protein
VRSTLRTQTLQGDLFVVLDAAPKRFGVELLGAEESRHGGVLVVGEHQARVGRQKRHPGFLGVPAHAKGRGTEGVDRL